MIGPRTTRIQIRPRCHECMGLKLMDEVRLVAISAADNNVLPVWFDLAADLEQRTLEACDANETFWREAHGLSENLVVSPVTVA